MAARGQRRLREAVLCAAVLLGVFHSISCVRFEVKGSSNTCILADLSVNFTVGYNNSGKQDKANFALPSDATADKDKSTCGSNGTKPASPLLVINFGNGNSLSVNFTTSDTQYAVDVLVFSYNLSDKVLFPGAVEYGTKEVTSNKSEISAKKDSIYSCTHPHVITVGNTTITFYDVKLEAYMQTSNYSKDATSCKEDVSPTSAPPVPPTAAPANHTTPDVGEYRVNETGGRACLMANMGLQLNFTYVKKDNKVASYEFNINPKHITFLGACTNESATLILFNDAVYVVFNFTLNNTASQVYLHLVHVNTSMLPDAKEPKFTAENGSLSYLQTTAHKSFKCSAKQTFQITSNFTINTYKLHVQAFDIDENKFGPAMECAEDQNGMLVPIIVGAALAGLVLIVLIAYLIGRKRSHAGYQTI